MFEVVAVPLRVLGHIVEFVVNRTGEQDAQRSNEQDTYIGEHDLNPPCALTVARGTHRIAFHEVISSPKASSIINLHTHSDQKYLGAIPGRGRSMPPE